MSDPQGQIFSALGASVAAALSGFVGMVVGVKVQGTEIKNLKERMDREWLENREWLARIDGKIDRLTDRLFERE